MKAVRTLALAVTLMAGAVGAQASLVNRGGGMIYDTELNVTWLQNWNQAVGSAYDTASPGTGRMTWGDAKAWADTLVFGGFDDWRLPTMLDTGVAGCDYREAGGTDCGFNVQTKSGATVYSEMAHLLVRDSGQLGLFHARYRLFSASRLRLDPLRSIRKPEVRRLLVLSGVLASCWPGVGIRDRRW